MPKADTPHTTSRRALFGATAGLALSSALPAVAGPVTPDAELLALCAKFVAGEAEYRAHLAKMVSESEAGNENLADDHEDSAAEVGDLGQSLLEQIAKLPARTSAGHRAKAATVHAFYEPDFDDSFAAGRVLWSLVLDLVGHAA